MVWPWNGAWFFYSSTVLAMLLGAVTTFALANWQWQRAQLHRAQLAAFYEHSGVARALIAWPVAAAPDMSRVSVVGQALGAPLLLENSLLEDGRDGARVLQPYQLADGSAVLVDRGWLADGIVRVPPPLSGIGQIGRWLSSPRRFTLSGAIIAGAGRVDALDLPALERRLHRPLRRGVVVLDRTPAPLLPWPQRPDVDPSRNDGYALQWLLMSLGLSGAAVYTAWKKFQS